MFRQFLGAAALMSLLIGLTPAAAGAVEPSAPDFSIQVQGVFGSGCPRGSTDVSYSPDHRSFVVTYSEFGLRGGDYANCTITISVEAPPGWSYALSSLFDLVAVSLAPGSSARLQTDAWFTGLSSGVSADDFLFGPSSGLWTSISVPSSLGYLPCGYEADLRVNRRLSVNGSPSSFAMLRTTVGPNLLWRRC